MNQPGSAADAMSVRDVQDHRREDQDLAYTTVVTVLDRLLTKQVVQRERDGRAFRYSPALTGDAATSEVLNALVIAALVLIGPTAALAIPYMLRTLPL